MSFARFEASTPLGSPNRITLKALRKNHGHEVHTAAEWQGLIDAIRAKPVGRDNLRRPAVRR